MLPEDVLIGIVLLETDSEAEIPPNVDAEDAVPVTLPVTFPVRFPVKLPV